MPADPTLPAVTLVAGAPRTGALAIGVVDDGDGPQLPRGVRREVVAARGFEARIGQVVALPGDQQTRLLVGLGRSRDLTPDVLRTAAAAAARAAAHEPSLALDLLARVAPRVDREAAGRALVEGALLASYTYTRHKSRPSTRARLERVQVVAPASRALQAGIDRGLVTAAAVRYVRDLVNEPPGSMTPSILASHAQAIAEAHGLEMRVWDEHDLAREGCGGLLGVSLGSDEPPRLIRLAYEPPQKRRGAEGPRRRPPTLAFVGKGITFDSGGLSLKTGDGMMTMKCDMAGAAAVLAAMEAIAALGAPVRVLAYLVCTENLPGPKAIKPGDVLVARNKTTIEVLNTDAEGRLALADGLSLAVEDRADAIVDVATLTGAQVVALGTDISGVLSNHDGFCAQVEAAAARAGEDVWRLPLPAKYRRHIDSPVADVKNIGPAGRAGTIMAGLFLQEFVGGRPWAHLDIAGPAFVDVDEGILTRGGTGVAVRTLVELARAFVKP